MLGGDSEVSREDRHALLAAVSDLSNPQPRYQELMAEGGFLTNGTLVYN